MERDRVPTLGELMIRRGLISEADLETALAEHLGTGRRLGEILLEHGHLDAEGLEGLLGEQLRLRAEGGPADEQPREDDVPPEGARGIALLREQLAAAEAELTRHLSESGTHEAAAAAAEVPGALPSEAEPVPVSDEPGEAAPLERAFVLFVPSPSGYRLIERTGRVPAIGEEIGVSGGTLVVAKVGASPLPGDLRRCAYLEAPS